MPPVYSTCLLQLYCLVSIVCLPVLSTIATCLSTAACLPAYLSGMVLPSSVAACLSTAELGSRDNLLQHRDQVIEPPNYCLLPWRYHFDSKGLKSFVFCPAQKPKHIVTLSLSRCLKIVACPALVCIFMPICDWHALLLLPAVYNCLLLPLLHSEKWRKRNGPFL